MIVSHPLLHSLPFSFIAFLALIGECFPKCLGAMVEMGGVFRLPSRLQELDQERHGLVVCSASTVSLVLIVGFCSVSVVRLVLLDCPVLPLRYNILISTP